MPAQKQNTFTSFELNAEETKLGCVLTTLNVAKIQNLRSQIAEEKLNLVFTPNDVLSYTQQEAYLKGQLDILSHLLAENESSQQFHNLDIDKE